MSHIITLSFGSNLGDKEANIIDAYSLLQNKLGKMIKKSSMYETKAWGFESKESFLNSVAVFQTDKEPIECLKIINEVEESLGRKRSGGAGYEDRVIDVDIIFYDDIEMSTPELKIPHPLWQVRDFVKKPLKEIGIIK